MRKRAVTPTPADEILLTTAEVLRRVPLRRETIWRLVRENKFPAPVRLTSSRLAWRLSAILAWISEREQRPITPRPYFGSDKDNNPAA
jgi:prophage regulatory protein